MDTSKLTPNEIAESWKGLFCFKKENGTIMGLRSPQIGALHSMLAHVEDGEERAIVVMPTGTGKTETMLAFLIANMCKKFLLLSHLMHFEAKLPKNSRIWDYCQNWELYHKI